MLSGKPFWKNNATFFRRIKKIQEAKSWCYPTESSRIVTETSAEIMLQDLLNHTSKGLLDAQEPVLDRISSDAINSLTLCVKCGFDGSTLRSRKLWEFTTTENKLRLTSLVPIQLYSQLQNQEVVWQNPSPSSTRLMLETNLEMKW